VSTEIKKRKVLTRDHDHIAQHITTEKKRRENSEWRRKHTSRWAEVDRQIAMDPPITITNPEDKGDWHNAIQLGDLTDASETLTADTLRMIMPTGSKYFIPHVRVGKTGTITGEPIPPAQQRAINGVIRNFMFQQQKDFGLRSRLKLAVKEVLHHGAVVATMSTQRMFKYEGGANPRHLVAPAPTVYSMWNCYPDPSPYVMGTELFYKGSMIIEEWMPLQEALQVSEWINQDKLQETHGKKDLHEHISILHYYGDIFLKRHDGNVLFPNRHTVASGGVFLNSTVNPTPYSPVIYTGYERDDIRDPYFTSPIVKRAPMGKFATHMANRTMDSIDLLVEPPVQYDSLDNSMRGDGPTLYPGAKIPSRGGSGMEVLEIGNPSMGLAALQWAKQQMQEGTTVDAVRKGVSPGTEQTATEVMKTEQRAEVREVEFSSVLEDHFLLPLLNMQHDINRREMTTYEFYNDEPHSPDHMKMHKKDLPETIIFEVTGSRSILGEQERTNRFAQVVGLASQSEMLASETDWKEVARQMWDDSKQKDPERFVKEDEEEGPDPQVVQLQEQFQEQAQQMQEQMGQLQQEGQKLAAEVQKLTGESQQKDIALKQGKLQHEQLQLEKATLREQLKLTAEMERAEKEVKRQVDSIRDQQNAEVVEEPAPAPEPKPQGPIVKVISGGLDPDVTKKIEIIRDSSGNLSGAIVKPVEEEQCHS